MFFIILMCLFHCHNGYNVAEFPILLWSFLLFSWGSLKFGVLMYPILVQGFLLWSGSRSPLCNIGDLVICIYGSVSYVNLILVVHPLLLSILVVLFCFYLIYILVLFEFVLLFGIFGKLIV